MRVQSRRGITPMEWKQLSENEQHDIISWHIYTDSQLDKLYGDLKEQKANTPEVTTKIAILRLGL